MFDNEAFWSALEAAGMLVEVKPASGDPFMAEFARPDELQMNGMLHATDYQIEYQTKDVTLERNSEVTIAGEGYRVTQTPVFDPDGYFASAPLEKLS